MLVVLAWLAVRSRPPRVRRAHALIAGGLTGDLVYALLTWRYGDLEGVSAADALWIAGYPLIAAGLIRMTRLRAPGRLRAALLDGLAMATVVASMFTQLMVLPAVAGQSFAWTRCCCSPTRCWWRHCGIRGRTG